MLLSLCREGCWRDTPERCRVDNRATTHESSKEQSASCLWQRDRARYEMSADQRRKENQRPIKQQQQQKSADYSTN